jgi:predicted phosphate transport protein (TIGR00153 family)
MYLENWLQARRTVKAMTLVVEHSRMVTGVVELLLKCIRSAVENRKEELESDFDLLKKKEAEADSLRRRIIEELTRGELSTEERVALMRLGRQIDWIADCSHGAGRTLVLFDLSQMPKQIQDLALEMCSVVAEGTVKVAKCIQELMDGKLEESLKEADEVERLEEKVDKLYQKARGGLKDIEANVIQVGSIILLTQFLDYVEQTADSCEDTCDQARVMAVMLSKREN